MPEKKKTTKKRRTRKATGGSKKTTKKATAKKTTTRKKSSTSKKKTTPKKRSTTSRKKKTAAAKKKQTTKPKKKRTTKKATTRRSVTQKKYKKTYELTEIAQLIESEGHLHYFKTPDHMAEFSYDEEMPVRLFGNEPEPGLTTQPAVMPTQSRSVAINRTHAAHHSPHVLNLQKLAIPNPDSADHQPDFMVQATEDGFWSAVRATLQSRLHYKKAYADARQFEALASLSIVSWFLYISHFLYSILNVPLRGVGRAIAFVVRAAAQHVRAMAMFLKVIMAGRMSREHFIDPEKAFVDVHLFGEPMQQRMGGLQFAYSPVAMKSVAMFLILSFAVVIPVKGMALLDSFNQQKSSVLGASESAYSSLQLALQDIQQFSWLTASEHFKQSQKEFETVYQKLQDESTLQTTLLRAIPSTKRRIETAEHLAQVGVEVSALGTQITSLLDALQSETADITLTNKIRYMQGVITEILATQERIESHMTYVDTKVLPDDIAQYVILLQQTLPQVGSSLEQIDDMLDFAYVLLGGDRQQRYVLLFQNSDELRPAGGFMGSLTTATIYQGSVVTTKTPGGGPYDWQGWLTDPTQAPKPLWLVNPVWQFQDANWYPDFPSSAEKVLSFYSQIEKERIDGVIGINSYILPELLELTGPIDMPAYEKKITADNAIIEIQKAVELEYDREENKPKKIIGDLFAEIIQRLENSTDVQLIEVLEVVNANIVDKDLQLYFKDPALQEKVIAWQWGGTIVDTNGDYLMIVNANIGGAKTDRYMTQQSTLQSDIQTDGSVVNTLTITRTHEGIADDIFYGANNVTYVQVYVPQGATLLDARGAFETPQAAFFEVPPSSVPEDDFHASLVTSVAEQGDIMISESFGKTVYGFWMQTNLGETTEVELRYTVPLEPVIISSASNNPLIQQLDGVLKGAGLKAADTTLWHSLYWQKQSGHHNHSISYTVQYPEVWSLDHMLRPGHVDGSEVTYEATLEQDISTGLLFGIE